MRELRILVAVWCSARGVDASAGPKYKQIGGAKEMMRLHHFCATEQFAWLELVPEAGIEPARGLTLGGF
jgi:hypothetical protein